MRCGVHGKQETQRVQERRMMDRDTILRGEVLCHRSDRKGRGGRRLLPFVRPPFVHPSPPPGYRGRRGPSRVGGVTSHETRRTSPLDVPGRGRRQLERSERSTVKTRDGVGPNVCHIHCPEPVTTPSGHLPPPLARTYSKSDSVRVESWDLTNKGGKDEKEKVTWVTWVLVRS